MSSISNCPHCQFAIFPEFQLKSWIVKLQAALNKESTKEDIGYDYFPSGDCPHCKRWLILAECQNCNNRYLNINESPTAPLCHLCEGILTPIPFTVQTIDELRRREAKLRHTFGQVCAGIMLLEILLQLILGLAIMS